MGHGTSLVPQIKPLDAGIYELKGDKLKTAFGGTRIVDLLVGDPLPRIC